MMTDPYKLRNLEQRIIKDADQTEFSAMLRGSVLVDAGLYDDRVSGAMDDFEYTDQTVTQGWHALDIQYETATSKVFDEIQRRSNLLGKSYPFKIRGNQLEYTASESLYYEFCLAVSTAPNVTAGDYVNLPRIFERTCAVLVKLFLGYDAGYIHVGSPRDQTVGTTFFKAMQKVNELTGEWIWNSITDFGNSPQTTGDEGVDFIAWKNTPDRRKGKIFIVGQCACGDDWTTKFNDLNLQKLSKWFHPISYVTPPVRAFATPYHLSNVSLANAQMEAGFVMDRARLTLISDSFVHEGELVSWRPSLEKMIRMTIPIT